MTWNAWLRVCRSWLERSLKFERTSTCSKKRVFGSTGLERRCCTNFICDVSFRVTELAEVLGIDAPAVTRKVQQLERLGFVSREPDLEDKRATRIQLTSDGEETLERVLDARRKRLARLFDGWTSKELRSFSASLSRFAEILTSEMEIYRD